MKLRARITWTTLAVSVPLTVSLLGIDARSRQLAAEEELHELVQSQLQRPAGRSACEAGFPHPGARAEAPRRPMPHPRHREPARLVGYAATGEAVDPGGRAITIPADLGDAPYVSRSRLLGGAVEILVPTPWGESRCAYVLATGTKEPWLGALLPDSPLWLLPLLLVFAAIIVAVGPVVRRLGALEAAVKARRETGAALSPGLLEDQGEVGALARAFDDAATTLESEAAARSRQEEALRDFLADTTHDVMIPLTVLQGHLAELVSHGDAKRALLEAIHETHYIASLVHNLGVVAKLDQPQPRVERTQVDLGALLERVVARHRPVATPRGIDVELSVPAPALCVNADLTLLEQAVGNLVYNAVRHNNDGGHVAVFADRSRADGFSIHVVDDGPGMTASERSRLLERGQRGDGARTRSMGGLGIGLSIVQRVCTLHDFALTFDTSAEGGLHVRIDGPSAARPRA